MRTQDEMVSNSLAMAEVRKLSKPPIREALIDIRVETRLEDPIPVLEGLAESIAEDYPKRERRFVLQGEISIAPSSDKTSTQREHVGFRCGSEDGKNVVQFRRDGFTFNRIGDYTSWEEIHTEAWRHWEQYRKAMNPEAVRRLAVRYINDISIPIPCNLNEFFRAPPTTPTEGQRFSEFLTRIVFDVPDSYNFKAIVVQATGGSSPEERRGVIILDIDVFLEEQLEPDDPAIPECFQLLRVIKNRIFFDSITEKTLEMYA